MQIFYFCLGKQPQANSLKSPSNSENWLKIFSKLKDYLLVSICDPDLVSEALVIFHNFLTSPALKH